MFIAADDAAARALVVTFIESLEVRPMNVGPLPMARALEHICLLSLGFMTHSVKHTDVAIGVSFPG